MIGLGLCVLATAAAIAAALTGYVLTPRLARRRARRERRAQEACAAVARLRTEGQLAINPEAAFQQLLADHPELRTEDSQ